MSESALIIAGIAAPLIGACALFYAVMMKRRRRSTRGVCAPAPAGVAAGLRRLLCAERFEEDFWIRLESTLIASDAGPAVTRRLLAEACGAGSPADVEIRLRESMIGMLRPRLRLSTGRPHVIMVLGANGVGKTTTIAKLARMHMDGGRRVLLVAGDTFRAAAIDQLREWAERLGCDVVAQRPGADAAAVAHDGVASALARGHDVVIVDTAGRLHTKRNLMEELGKISRVISRAAEGAPHEKLLVVDATVGCNGLAQARSFNDAVGITGVVVAKLDGTARGGVMLAVVDEIGAPVTHIGIGEGVRDLKPFDAEEFVEAMLK